jgi:hypothetical protein
MMYAAADEIRKLERFIEDLTKTNADLRHCIAKVQPSTPFRARAG